ncbi:MAG: hypothetical protein N838_11830 [Thiohalocapsa sp. PB-PSB1]|jgi:hypothetical protein|nr:MAG: hypothetical protein N838_11830 [Thiohalocapsa sp. PB-PSB1]
MPEHDASYKLLFSHREMVADLIRGFVDGDWTRALDFETLERVREIGVSHDLREREDDILWRVRLTLDGQRRWLYVYLLLEFQSTVDQHMALRLMTYVGLLYQDLVKAGEIGTGDALPPVLPIVLYNGSDAWAAKTSRGRCWRRGCPTVCCPGSRSFAILYWWSKATKMSSWPCSATWWRPCFAWSAAARRRTSSGCWRI